MTTPAVEKELGGILVPRRGDTAMVRGEGLWLWDHNDRRYLDLTSAYGTTPLGYCHPQLTAAISEQAGRLQALSSNFFNDRRAELFAALDRNTPAHFTHYYLCNSGTEAIEAGLKLAHIATERAGQVALKQGFHGRTLGALAVTWNPRFRKPFAPLLAEARFVSPDNADELEAAVGEDTGVFVAEPIQGESGVRLVDAALLSRAQELCREHGAMFLVDEIQTGFGRAGSWFASDALGLEPDLMAMAKGIGGGFPMGAVAMTAEVAGKLKPGMHGSTFGGSPLACAASIATMEVLADEDLPEQSRLKGERLLDGLRAGLGSSPGVREIRGRGLMVGIELRQKVAPTLAALQNEHGIITLPAGPTVLRLLPALTISDEQIDEAVTTITAVLGS